MNPALIVELLRIGTQLLTTLNNIKQQAQVDNPELWKQISSDFNAAAAAFMEK